MRSISRAVAALRQGRVTDQRGFALGVTLVVVGVASLTITALVGLLLVTMRVSEQHAAASLEHLALDGAVEAAINHMRVDEAALTPEEYCAADFPGRLSDLTLDARNFDGVVGNGAGPLDGVDIELECERTTAAATPDGVRLVGRNGYTPPPHQPGLGVDWRAFPWSDVAEIDAAELDSVTPNLVHLGHRSLRFDSGVTIRNGSAVLRDDATRSPAVSAEGDFLQADPGLLAGATPAEDDCGLLVGLGGKPVGPEGEPSQAGRVNDVDGVPECNDPSAANVDQSPTDADVGFAVANDFSELQNRTVPNVQSMCNISGPKVIELEPGYYGPAAVAELTKVLNNTLGEWGGSACRRKTVWFKPAESGPSIFYFDAPVVDLGNPSAYFIAGVPLGWSAPQGAALDADVHLLPEAPLCDRTEPGATFVLAPHTELRHTGGRLALCPEFDPNGDPYPAIYQETAVGTAPSASDPSSSLLSFHCNNILAGNHDLASGDRCRHTITRHVDMSLPAGLPLESVEFLTSGYQLSRFSTGQSTEPDGAPQVTPPHNIVDVRETKIDVYPAGGGSEICSTGWHEGLPTGVIGGPRTTAIEILTGTCAAHYAGATTNDMLNVQLRVRHRLTWALTPVEMGILNELSPQSIRQSYWVDGFDVALNHRPGLVANSDVHSPAAGSDNHGLPSGFEDPQEVLTPGPVARPDMAGCPHLVCRRGLAGISPEDRFSSSIRLDDISVDVPQQFTDNGIDPRLTDLRVNLGLDPSGTLDGADVTQMNPVLWFLDLLTQGGLSGAVSETNWRYFLREMRLRVQLDTPSSGSICATTDGPVASIQEISIDLLDINTRDPQCDGVVQSYSQLDGSRLTVTFEMPCVRNPNGPTNCLRVGPGNQDVLQIRPPDVDTIELAMRTDSYDGPRPHSVLTMDARTTPGPTHTRLQDPAAPNYGASANIMGNVWLPLHDLHLRWRGKTTAVPDEGIERPVVSGDLVLASLASTMAPEAEAGLVCCDLQRPEAAAIDVRASVGGEPRLMVSVNLRVPASSGEPLRAEVIDWRDCRRAACTFRHEEEDP